MMQEQMWWIMMKTNKEGSCICLTCFGSEGSLLEYTCYASIIIATKKKCCN